MTLLDFPGRVACTVFTVGCNFRCPFCHNSSLVVSPAVPELSQDDFFAFLRKRQGLLDGVAITGGEPPVFFRKRVTKQEEDDGSTKVFGKWVRMKRDHIETRCRFLTDFNFIIAAKGSAFNCNEFNRTSEDFFEGLLNGSVLKLSGGYSYVEGPRGGAVKSVKDVSVNDSLKINVTDGYITAVVKDKQEA